MRMVALDKIKRLHEERQKSAPTKAADSRDAIVAGEIGQDNVTDGQEEELRCNNTANEIAPGTKKQLDVSPQHSRTNKGKPPPEATSLVARPLERLLYKQFKALPPLRSSKNSTKTYANILLLKNNTIKILRQPSAPNRRT